MIHCNSEFRAYALKGRFNEEEPYRLVYILIISRTIEGAAR